MTERLWGEYSDLSKKSQDPIASEKLAFCQRNSREIKVHNADTKPEISIIIPAYNEEMFLPRTLASLNNALKHANGKSVNVIVVDNGSTDHTSDLAEECGVEIVREEKKGIGMARQRGLDSVTTSVKYILTTDADTVVPRDWVDRHYRYLNEPGTVFTYGDVRYKTDRDFCLRTKLVLCMYSAIASQVHGLKRNLTGISNTPGANSGFRKTVANIEGGYNSSFACAEDIEISNRFAKHGKITRIPNLAVITSARKMAELGVVSMGVSRTYNNLKQIITGKIIKFNNYQDIRGFK